MNYLWKNPHFRKLKEGRKRRVTEFNPRDRNSVFSSQHFTSVQKYLGAGTIPPSPLHTVQHPPKPKPVTAYGRSGVKSGLAKGINERFLYLRKENHLNTCYNLRKNKLKELTKANK